MPPGMKTRLARIAALLFGLLLVAGPALAQDAGGAPPVHAGWNYKLIIAIIFAVPAIVFAIVFFWYNAGREKPPGDARTPQA